MTMSRRSFVGTSGAVAAAAVLRVVLGRRRRRSSFAARRIRLLVGTTPGAGYDLIARLLAPALSRLIPGNPSVVVENMPGAGSLVDDELSLQPRAARRHGDGPAAQRRAAGADRQADVARRRRGEFRHPEDALDRIEHRGRAGALVSHRFPDQDVRRPAHHQEHRSRERARRRQLHRCGAHQQPARHQDGDRARLSGHEPDLPRDRARRGRTAAPPPIRRSW